MGTENSKFRRISLKACFLSAFVPGLNSGHYFSKTDLSDAYLQVPVDEESMPFLTINTHRGLYQYTHLVFGVKTAPAIFQQIMDAMLNGIPGAFAYLDDIIIVSKTIEEHREILKAVFKRLQEFGFTVRPQKCEFARSTIKFLGDIVSREGRRPNSDKIQAIMRMPEPHDLRTLRSFLGLVNHYGIYIKDMRDLRAPLDELLKQDRKWLWTRDCQNAFDRIKSVLSSDLLLTHFDPKLEIVVAADASNYGIGAVVSHRFPDGTEKAIYHASRALTQAEKNYGQIEKEGLALVFAVKKFHRMLHGRKFLLLTDHKPLLAVFGAKKGIPVYTANRLQRWATTLMGYDFKIEYRSTDSFGQADALSRLIASQQASDEDIVIASISVDADVQRVFDDSIRSLPVTAQAVSEATATDPLLQECLGFLQTGWPTSIPSPNLKQLYNRRDSLSIFSGCLLFGDRVVIPRALQQRVLNQLHVGHPGIVRMKALARSHVYWPGLDSEVEKLVKECTKCAAAAKLPVKTELSSWPVPCVPWSRIHIDYAGPYHGHSYLVVIDAFSKWPEVFKMNSTTTTATLVPLRQIFARFGNPEVIVTDNGTQFVSSQFENFCSSNGIKHMKAPVYHPQSNGQAERFVDTFKRAMTKLRGEGTVDEIIDTFLMSYRSTPNSALADSMSPAQAMFGRSIRTALDLIHPVNTPTLRNEPMESQFNKRHGARKRYFTKGDKVYVRTFQNQQLKWIPGQVLGRRGKVMYDVKTNTGIYVRHANHLRSRAAEERHDTQVSLDLLCDTFGVPLNANANLGGIPHRSRAMNLPTCNDQATNQAQPEPRRSVRQRRLPHRLQVDPRNQSYEDG